MRKLVCGTMALAFCLILLSACTSTMGRTAGTMVDDATIANAIRAKIIEDKELSILKISTDVFNGNVTFTGVIPDKTAEGRLVEMAGKVEGVKSITSNLKIQK
jgi:hyperosmotically inducible periplasmic protein